MAHSRKLIAVALSAGLALPSSTWAQDAKALSVVFNVGAASDYEFRGISQTHNKAQIFAGADAAIGSIGYAGAWLSNVDFLNGTRMEYDLYGGVKPVVGPVTFDLGVIRYGYAGQRSGPDEAYTEWKVAPSMALGPAVVGLAYFYSDNFFGDTGPAHYFEVNGFMPIAKSPFSVSGALGRRQVRGPLDYTTWNLGVGYVLNDHVGFDLRYWDTDEHSFGSIYKSKLVLGVKATFP